MPEHASAEDDVPPRGRRGRYALVALCLAPVAAAVGLGVVVGSWPAPPPGPDPHPGAVRSDYAIIPASPTRRQPLNLPSFRGRTVAEASAAAEAAGATPVVIFDARWNRPVTPDWVVCNGGESYLGANSGDMPSGDFQIAAVPAGDPCP